MTTHKLVLGTGYSSTVFVAGVKLYMDDVIGLIVHDVIILAILNVWVQIVTGNSVHNQRIDRFWCDLHVHYSVTHLYYRLEYLDLLDPTNEQHLYHVYALHYVYIPRINIALSQFRDG